MTDKWIPKTELVVGQRYECDARNFTEGTWNGEGFDYMRYKFGDTFPDVEYHWDDGAPHGTCKPIKEMKQRKQREAIIQSLSTNDVFDSIDLPKGFDLTNSQWHALVKDLQRSTDEAWSEALSRHMEQYQNISKGGEG